MNDFEFFLHNFDNIFQSVRLKNDILDFVQIDRNTFAIFGQGINGVAYSKHHNVQLWVRKQAEEVFSKDVGLLFENDLHFLDIQHVFTLDFFLL